MEDNEDPYFSPFFQYKVGVLHCEDRSCREVIEWLKSLDIFPYSPAYVYSKNKLISSVEEYKKPLAKMETKFHLNYSMKANMNPHILSIMKEMGCSVTLVSGMELRLALKLGFQPNFMVLNGNGKQEWEIELAIQHECLLNIDSYFNLRQTLKVCHKTGKDARVLLRVTPDIDPDVHQYINTGTKGTKFGLEVGSLDAILDVIKGHRELRLVGLHCHLGSAIEKPQVFRESADIMIQLYRKLKTSGFTDMKYLNLGGGLSIPYRRHAWRTSLTNRGRDSIAMKQNLKGSDGVNALDSLKKERKIVQFVEEMETRKIASPEDVIREINEVVKDDDVTVILEPGRSLVAGAGILLTTVLGVKKNGKKNYIVVDGAMTEVLRPALYDAYHHIDLTEPSVFPESDQLFDIVGPVCESADFLGKDRYMQTPNEGSLLAVFDVGAYCSSMGSNYNLRPRPAEVLIDKKNYSLIRPPDSFEDLMAPYFFIQNHRLQRKTNHIKDEEVEA